MLALYTIYLKNRYYLVTIPLSVSRIFLTGSETCLKQLLKIIYSFQISRIMSKWADFVVSGIKKGPGLANISHVQIHEDFGSEFGNPELIDKKTLASHIKKGKKYITIYKKNEIDWEPGEIVNAFIINGETHVRTDDNKVEGDHLGTLPEIES